MKLEHISVYLAELKLREPFTSAFGTFDRRKSVIIEIKADGLSGWGEAPALPVPFYNSEDTETVLHILKDFICPVVLQQQPQNINSFNEALSKIAGNNMAKAGVEGAFLDLKAKAQGISLSRFLGGHQREIRIGAVLPRCSDLQRTMQEAQRLVALGYQRIKVKILKGQELAVAEAFSKKELSQQVMFDLNAGYKRADFPMFLELDRHKLMMIEQPLKPADFVGHAELQSKMNTPICLDESIENVENAATAIALQSCKIINIKPARVAGLCESGKIHDLAAKAGMGLWVGGMFDTGIGKAHNLAVASMEYINYPSEISESSRYFEQDVIEPPIRFSRPGIISLSDSPGIGVEVIKSKLIKIA